MRCWYLVIIGLCVSSIAYGESQEIEDTMIRVTSQPTGARVTINGVDCGTTPASIAVSPGRHSVTIEASGRRMRTTVNVEEGALSEVHLDLGEDQDSVDLLVIDGRDEVEDDEGDIPPSDSDDEVDEADGDERGSWRAEGEVTSSRWARRVYQWPLVLGALEYSLSWRKFSVPINPDIDTSSRTEATMETGRFGVMGFRLVINPFFRLPVAALRGLGFEFAYAHNLILRVLNRRLNQEVESEFQEGELLLAYRLVLGRPDAGAAIVVRTGWHRTEFFLGDVGNDIVPPMTYDALRIDVGAEIPLATRHVLAVVGTSFFGVIGIGEYAVRAYNQSGSRPDLSGFEARTGVIGRVGGIEAALMYEARVFFANNQGVGQGWGHDPTTRIDLSGNGIQTTDRAVDQYHRVRVTLGYRW